MINLTKLEKAAIAAINEEKLTDLISRAIEAESLGDIRELPLWDCGSYVNQKLANFSNAINELRLSKSSKKRERTGLEAIRAGSDLVRAVQDMKKRMQEEQRDGTLFRISDRIRPPIQFQSNLSVTVGYQWRASIEDEWSFGNITFEHHFVPRLDFSFPTPKRKVSRAQQKRDLEATLATEWEYLMQSALFSVRDFFKQGGDGANIPKTFRVVPDRHSGSLNNFSLVFWETSVERL